MRSGKLFEQAAAEFFLLGDLLFQFAALGYVYQSALIADQLAGVVPDGARGVEENGGGAIAFA